MFIIIGIAVVVFAVLTGFLIAGGNLILLLQYAEFIVIVGAAVGGLLISAPLSLLKKVITEIPKLLKPDHYSKEDYLLLLKSFNDLFVVAQRDGLLSIEKHIENPDQSDILSKNPKFINNPFLRNFFCDTLKVMLSGGVPPHELEGLMDVEIETFEIESKPVAATVARVGDSLPGLGIVAAVLGIIITMSSIDQGAQVVGEHVAAALVGTFLGVLLAYGFVNPIAAALEHDVEGRLRLLQTIKACVVAYAKGNPPIISVEIGRRTIFSDERPTFAELESYIRSKANVGT
jgi:chemotaxis protein MotA